jgi:hypothetical protein
MAFKPTMASKTAEIETVPRGRKGESKEKLEGRPNQGLGQYVKRRSDGFNGSDLHYSFSATWEDPVSCGAEDLNL